MCMCDAAQGVGSHLEEVSKNSLLSIHALYMYIIILGKHVQLVGLV